MVESADCACRVESSTLACAFPGIFESWFRLNTPTPLPPIYVKCLVVTACSSLQISLVFLNKFLDVHVSTTIHPVNYGPLASSPLSCFAESLPIKTEPSPYEERDCRNLVDVTTSKYQVLVQSAKNTVLDC